MKRTLLLVIAISVSALAQTKDPVTAAVKEILPRQQKNMVAAADEMPADKFGFKPTPGQISFGHLVLHIAETNKFLCAKIGDEPVLAGPDLKNRQQRYAGWRIEDFFRLLRVSGKQAR